MGLLDSLERVLTTALPIGVQVYQTRQAEKALEIQRDIARANAQGAANRAGAAAQAARRMAMPSFPPYAMPGRGGAMLPAAGPSPGFMPVSTGGAPPMMQPANLPFVDVLPEGASRLMSPYVPTMAGARAQPFVAVNPMSGALTWFKPAGRPILWSGDLTAAKRVKRVAARARRSSR